MKWRRHCRRAGPSRPIHPSETRARASCVSRIDYESTHQKKELAAIAPTAGVHGGNSLCGGQGKRAPRKAAAKTRQTHRETRQERGQAGQGQARGSPRSPGSSQVFGRRPKANETSRASQGRQIRLASFTPQARGAFAKIPPIGRRTKGSEKHRWQAARRCAAAPSRPREDAGLTPARAAELNSNQH